MLTYRLAGTTDETGSTATNPSTIRPTTAQRNHGAPHIFPHHGAARNEDAVLLTWGFVRSG